MLNGDIIEYCKLKEENTHLVLFTVSICNYTIFIANMVHICSSLIQEAERNTNKMGGVWTLLRYLFNIITFHMSCVTWEPDQKYVTLE